MSTRLGSIESCGLVRSITCKSRCDMRPAAHSTHLSWRNPTLKEVINRFVENTAKRRESVTLTCQLKTKPCTNASDSGSGEFTGERSERVSANIKNGEQTARGGAEFDHRRRPCDLIHYEHTSEAPTSMRRGHRCSATSPTLRATTKRRQSDCASPEPRVAECVHRFHYQHRGRCGHRNPKSRCHLPTTAALRRPLRTKAATASRARSGLKPWQDKRASEGQRR